MSDGIVIGSLSVNGVTLMAFVFAAGRYVQRIATIEKKVEVLEDVKAEVSLAGLGSDVRHLSGLVATLQTQLQAIAKLLSRSHTGLSAESGGD